MRKYLGRYVPEYSPHFKKQKLPPDVLERVENNLIPDLIADPYHNTEFGKGRYRGKRYKWINRFDRLFFVICEECRGLNHQRYNLCRECEDTSDNKIIVAFVILGHKY